MADADFNVKAIISAQTSQFEKGMKNAQSSINTMSKSIQGVQKLLKSAFSVVGIGASLKAITDFGKSCVQSANQANKTFRILDTTIKATGADAWTSTKELEGLAKTLSDETNYSVTEIEKMQSVLLGFRDITDETFKDASNAVLDMATVMGMDLTSAVQTVGKALDDPVKGLDSLRRQGFQFTDQQKAELTQLVKTGKKIEAQKIILDELSRSYGGAAKAGQDSFAQQRHAVENFSDAFGAKLIPTIKLFAQENAKAINSLRDGLDNIDFNQVGAYVVATFTTIKNSMNSILDPIKSVGSNFKNFISGIDFKPIISALDTLIGAFKRINEIRFDLLLSSIGNIKSIFSEVGNNVNLEKIVEVINLIVGAFVFLAEEVSKIFSTLQDNIKIFVLNAWNSIKSLFEAGNKALADSETDIQSWGDFFYNIFNNTFKSIQDVIYSITALIKGDWTLAWEYMKLACARVADSILDILSTIVNAFPQMVDKITEFLNNLIEKANKVRKWMGLETWDLIEPLRKVDFSKSSGLEKFISDTEKKISDITGKAADKNIVNMKRFSDNTKGTLGKFVDGFKEATEQAKKELDKIGEYQPVISAGGDIGTTDIENDYKMYSEWDSKLLEQRLGHLKEWQEEYHKVNLDLIEIERQRAKDADKTGAETEKINKYYNNKIVEENKRAEEAKRNHVKETVSKVIDYTKKIASNTIAVFKQVVSTIKDVFTNIVDIFDKLFSFSIDSALDALLEYEDAILTFFVETVPKLPEFVKSVVGSVSTLITNVKNVLETLDLKEIILEILGILSENLPSIVSDMLNIFVRVVNDVIDALIQWLGEGDGLQMLFDIILTIQQELEKLVVENLEKIVDFIAENIDKIADFIAKSMASANRTLPRIIKAILNLIVSLIEAIARAFENEDFINSIVESIEGIIDAISEITPKLIGAVVKLIINVITALIPRLPEIILYLINAIVQSIPQILGQLTKAFGDIFSKIFSGDFWWRALSNLGDVLWDIIKSALTGHSDGGTTTGSTAGDIGLGILTGGISTIGSWFGWWAKGTNSAPKGLSIVGEAGPELVQFHGGEKVFNNTNTEKMLAGAGRGNNNFNITFNNTQDTTAFTMMQQLKAYNRQMAINGVM